ncbi:MAG: DUF4386 domain-containing protein [Chitinophagaceae bacterium]|nr:DUF4386 domain-containing protein [Chitinophagaceae bacterium]
MNPSKSTARLAGFLYLIVIVTGIFSLGYVPSQLIDGKDAYATCSNILASPWLFRWGIISSAICYIAFLLLPLVLYKLLHPVNETSARLMVVLAVVSVPISLLNLQHKYEVLDLLKNAGTITDGSPVPGLVMQSLRNYNSGLLISQIFWGLWLLPFGWLVWRSEFLPKILGFFLMLGCIGYVIDFVGTTGVPGYNDTVIGNYITKPATIGEIGICLWMLIVGIWKKNATNYNSIE